MCADIYDMDKQKHVRYNSESSNASTSGYSTMSPNGGGAVSMSSSPIGSPRTISLQTQFSNLILPNPNAPFYQQTALTDLPYRQMTAHTTTTTGIHLSNNIYTNLPIVENAHFMPNFAVSVPNHFGGAQTMMMGNTQSSNMKNKKEYPSELRILEHPVDKFRFRYKSEMHGTHGSLTGAKSTRTLKKYPEVELTNYNGPAKIRCSLFQANLDSPHSHQLVVRKDDHDICDPHELDVGPDIGFVAQYQNMGIIHTAKKYITNELLEKKVKRLCSQLGCSGISERQRQELYKETEKEAKAMNLNQVRLCFEAFKEEPDKSLTPIAAPVYTNPINNRKSAQTGELRILRLSIATGSVSGKDELILLVEKVSKKNIKVRFYQLDTDDELVWEAYGTFRESDVHHQYAIVCQTPAYKDKNLDKAIDVLIELVRPSDDERSYPLPFRYKPLDAVVSRKRRRTCSSAKSSTNNSFSSVELPETVTEQTGNMMFATTKPSLTTNTLYNNSDSTNNLTISEEFPYSREVMLDSEELAKFCPQNISDFDLGVLEKDGVSSSDNESADKRKQMLIQLNRSEQKNNPTGLLKNSFLQNILKIHTKLYSGSSEVKPSAEQIEETSKQVANIYKEHAENHDNETLIHEIILADNDNLCFKIFQILNQLKLTELFNTVLNVNNESGLHCASFHDQPKYIHRLLSFGADPNIQDKQGNTAIHVAVREQHHKCIESFLNFHSKVPSKKLNLTIKNYEDLTPLHLAIKLDDTTTSRKLLNYNGAVAHVRNSKDGNNAMHMAVLQQNYEIVSAILEARNVGDILNQRNNAGYSPIDLAKQISISSGKSANKILDILMPLCMDVDCQLSIQIKEEDMSSTTDDEEETSEKQMSMDLIKTEIKVEEFEVEERENENEKELQLKDTNIANEKLTSCLNDTNKFKKLAKNLNENNKWKQLANISEISQLFYCWSCADDMLEYIKNRSSDIEFSAFAVAAADDLNKVLCS